MIDDIISDENAFKVSDSIVTDESKCSFDGDLYCVGHDILRSKDEYERVVKNYSPRFIQFSDIIELEKYVNYSYNTFVSTYNILTREGGICKTISARDQLGYLDAIAGLSGCIMSLATAPFTGGVGAIAGLVAGANNIPKDITEASKNMSSAFGFNTNRKKAEVLLNRNFNRAVQDIDDMSRYLDKFIYLLALQYILSKNTTKINDLNRRGFCDRVLLRTIKSLGSNPSINIDELEIRVIVAYIAATLYIKYNYTIISDIPEAEIVTEMSKPANQVREDVKTRQRYFYALVEKWMEAALHCIFIHPDIIYNAVRATFREQSKEIGIHLTHIDNKVLHYERDINMSEKIREVATVNIEL